MNRFKFKALFLVLLAGGILSAEPSLANQSNSYFPLPINVEGTQVKSNIFLGAGYDGTNTLFSNVKGTDSEKLFIKQQAGFLTSGDFTDYSASIYAPSNTGNSQQQFGLFSGAYKQLQPESLSGVFSWGGIDYALLKSKNFPQAFVPLLVVPNGGGFNTALGFALDPVIQNLSALGRALQAQPSLFAQTHAVGDHSIDFNSLVPAKQGGANKITFIFGGEGVDCRIKSIGRHKWGREDHFAGSFGGVIGFFQDSNMKLINGDVSGYVSTFSAASQTRLLSMFNGMTADQRQSYITYFAESAPQVKFVLDAGQIKIIYYRTVAGGPLAYAMVSEQGGRFQRVNADFQGNIDALLTSSAFMNVINGLARN